MAAVDDRAALKAAAFCKCKEAMDALVRVSEAKCGVLPVPDAVARVTAGVPLQPKVLLAGASPNSSLSPSKKQQEAKATTPSPQIQSNSAVSMLPTLLNTIPEAKSENGTLKTKPNNLSPYYPEGAIVTEEAVEVPAEANNDGIVNPPIPLPPNPITSSASRRVYQSQGSDKTLAFQPQPSGSGSTGLPAGLPAGFGTARGAEQLVKKVRGGQISRKQARRPTTGKGGGRRKTQKRR